MDAVEKNQLLIAAAYIPPLLLRMVIGYLRMKRRAKRAGEIFNRTLIQSGVPQGEAKKLTDAYTSMVSIRDLTRGFTDIPFLGRMG